MPRLIWVFAGCISNFVCFVMRWFIIRAASSEFVTYRLGEQRRFRRACSSTQSRQNLLCSLVQAVSQEEPTDRKPDPWPFWTAGHAHLKLSSGNAQRHKFAWRATYGMSFAGTRKSQRRPRYVQCISFENLSNIFNAFNENWSSSRENLSSGFVTR